MALSKDLLDVIDQPVYYINWDSLEIVKEVLVPSCQNDWVWYSYKNDIYLLESEIYEDEIVAAETLLGAIIKMKNEQLLYLSKKERQLIELIGGNVIEKVVG